MSTVEGFGPTAAYGFYDAAVVDAVGVVTANTYFAIYNPVTSGRIHVAYQANVESYSIGASGTGASMLVRRFTSYTGGTLQSASTVGRFITTMPNPRTEVLSGGPTLTGAGVPLTGFPPPFSTGTGTSSTSGRVPVSGASFVMLPGEGLAFSTTSGDTNQRWGIQYVWAEYPLG